MRLGFYGFIVSLIVLGACSGGVNDNPATASLSTREKMRYEQYMVQGKLLYQQKCSNCHQEDGSGLARLIPPLDSADYMLSDMGRTACIIKNGMEGAIEVNGILYNQPMPTNEQLTDIEVAQILTYVGNAWSNQSGYYSAGKVSDILEKCDE